MSQASKLFINTGLTYARMGVSIVIGLVATRIAFRYLGEEQFGLYGVLAAAVAVVTAFSDGLAAACERNFAYAIGLRDDGDLQRLFVTAVMMVGGIAAVLMAGAALLGGVAAQLAGVEAAQIGEAHLAIVCITFGAAATGLGYPARALLTAHQNFLQTTLLDLGEAGLRLAVVLTLLLLPGGKIVYYAGLLALVAAANTLAHIIIVRSLYASPRFSFGAGSRGAAGVLLQYAGWETVNSLGSRIRLGGSQLVLTGFRLPRAENAGFSLGQQASSYVATLGFAIRRAIAPAMVTLHARGQREQFGLLVSAASKLPMLVAVLAVVPFLLETEYLLKLWLGEVPAGAALLVRLFVIMIATDDLTRGHQIALSAVGRPGIMATAYCVSQGAGLLIGGLVMWLWRPEAWIVLASLTGAWIVAAVVVVLMYAGLTGLRAGQWARDVVGRVLLVYAGTVGLALVPLLMLPQGPVRLVLVGVATAVVLAGMGGVFGLSGAERSQVRAFAGRITGRFKGRFARQGAE